MPKDRNEPFRIGVTREVRRPDGAFVFAPFDLRALDVDGVTWEFLPEEARPLTPSLLAPYDGLYHFNAPVTRASLDGVERLTVLARHGVGLDFVDVPACTERGVAVTITSAGITRPMASAAVTLVLALAHRLRERDHALHRGDWGDGRFQPNGHRADRPHARRHRLRPNRPRGRPAARAVGACACS